MAESQQKRLRDEPQTLDFDDSNSKRHKPYTNILSLLDEEEEQQEPSLDLSAIFTTLQQELSSSTATLDLESPPSTAEDQTHHHHAEDDDGVNSVIRHLLEASDDELGIPNTDYNTVEIKSDEDFPFAFVDNGLWELEDVAANYYTVLQSELFM